MTDDEWTREVRFSVPFDHRDEDFNKGAHGMDIYFVLAKADGSGAITARIGTDWMRYPLKDKHFVPGTHERARWDRPGIDAGRAEASFRGEHQARLPNPQVVSLHMAKQDKDWWSGPGECDVLPGGECYNDSGFTVCDQFVDALFEGGHEAAWKWLEETYEEWTAPDEQ